MSYLYTTGDTRRLALGPATARRRVCVPITQDLYEALLGMAPEEEARLTTMLKYAMQQALQEWRTLTEIEGLTTGRENVPNGVSHSEVLERDVHSDVSNIHRTEQPSPDSA